jgi:hypothetical protein
VIAGLGYWASGDRDKDTNSASTGSGVENDDIKKETR